MRKKVLQLVSGNLINTFLNGILSIYLARTLGPEMRGVLALAMGSTLIVSMLLNFGAPHAAAYFIRHKPESAKKVLYYMNATLLFALVISPLLFYLGEDRFSSIFLDGNRMDLFMLALLVCIIPINLGNVMIGASVIAKGDASGYAAASNIGTVITFIVTLFMITFTKWQLHGALAGYLAGQTVTTVMFRMLFSEYVKSAERPFSEPLGWRDFFGYGLKAQIGSVASIAFKRLDLFVVGYFLNTAAVGYYAVALSLRDIALIVPRAMAGLIGGEMTDSRAQMSGAGVSLFKKSIFTVIAFSVITCIIGFLVFPFVIPMLYGNAYKEAVLPVAIAFVSIIPLSAAIIVNPAIGSYGKPLYMSLGNVISSFIALISILFLTKHYGLIGASISAILACFVLAIVSSIIFYFFVYRESCSRSPQDLCATK